MALPESTRRKLSLLELAQGARQRRQACRIMGYHRDTFYEVKRAFQVGGVEALLERKRGPRSPHPNRVSEEVEKRILDCSLAFPTHGAQRVANQLRLAGVNVGVGGVRGVWLRHDIETRYKRLLWLSARHTGADLDHVRTRG